MKNTNYYNFELLCSFLAWKSDSLGVSYAEEDIRNIDWEGVFKLADEYLVLPALYLELKRKGYLEFLDLEPRDFLQAIYELNYERNQKLKREALDVIRVLNSQGIQPVLLKGIAGLLTGVYEDDGERIIGDIDLLVEKFELAKVLELLVDSGCQCDSEELYQLVKDGNFHWQEIAVFTKSNLFLIDVHVRPIGSSGKQAFVSIEEARENAQVIEVEGVNALIPPPFFSLLHNFYHAQHLDHSYYLYGKINLRQLMDWGRLWEKYGNETCLERMASKLRIHQKSFSYRLYLLNARVFLGVPVLKGAKEGRIERLLFLRQKLCLQSIWFSRINVIFAYIISGPLLFSSEKLRLSFGDRPLSVLIVLRMKRFLKKDWYILRFKEIKKLW